jgi:hypothetical protein
LTEIHLCPACCGQEKIEDGNGAPGRPQPLQGPENLAACVHCMHSCMQSKHPTWHGWHDTPGSQTDVGRQADSGTRRSLIMCARMHGCAYCTARRWTEVFDHFERPVITAFGSEDHVMLGAEKVRPAPPAQRLLLLLLLLCLCCVFVVVLFRGVLLWGALRYGFPAAAVAGALPRLCGAGPHVHRAGGALPAGRWLEAAVEGGAAVHRGQPPEAAPGRASRRQALASYYISS